MKANRAYQFPTACSVVTLMPNVVLFGEDTFHEDFLSILVQRLSEEYRVQVSIRPYSVRGELTRMHYELGGSSMI